MFKELNKEDLLSINGGRKCVLVPKYYGNDIVSYSAEWADLGIVEYRYNNRTHKYEALYEHYTGPVFGGTF